eukprot:6172209-Pyramimonas_sp.AAC.1
MERELPRRMERRRGPAGGRRQVAAQEQRPRREEAARQNHLTGCVMGEGLAQQSIRVFGDRGKAKCKGEFLRRSTRAARRAL